MAKNSLWVCEACGETLVGYQKSAIVWHSKCPKKQLGKEFPRYIKKTWKRFAESAAISLKDLSLRKNSATLTPSVSVTTLSRDTFNYLFGTPTYMQEVDVSCKQCGAEGYFGAWCIQCDHYYEACICIPKPEYLEVLLICPECDSKW